MPPRVSRREQKRIKKLEQRKKAVGNPRAVGGNKKRQQQRTAPGTMEAMHEKIRLYALAHEVSVGEAKRRLGLKHQRRS